MTEIGEFYTDEWGTWKVTSKYGRALVATTALFEQKRVGKEPPPPRNPVFLQEVAASTTIEALKAALLKMFA